MSKSVHQHYNLDALEHFGLEHAPKYGVCSNSDGTIETIIATDSETTYNKIRDILSTAKTTKSIGSYSKAFLLPKSPISIDRIRSGLKEHKVTLSNEYDAADLYVVHDDFYDHFKNGQNIHSSCMMAKLWNYETFDSSIGWGGSKNYCTTTGNQIVYDTKCSEWFNIYSGNSFDTLYDAWMISGLAVNIAYKIDIGEATTISCDSVMHSSANVQVLTEQLMKDLITQIEGNEDDVALAGKILPTIDYKTNYHLLWEFANQIDSSLWRFNRNKDVQYWKEQAQIHDLNYRSAEDMILWLDEENLLDEISFRYLERIVRKEITIHNRNLYVFKIQVKPEYRKYLRTKKK